MIVKRTYLFTLLITALLSSALFAQNEVDPVKWEHKATHLGDNVFELVFKANIEDGWAVYSQELEEGGPLPSVFEFEDDGAKAAQLQGKIEEIGKLKEEFDPVFEMNVRKYYNDLTFKAKVKTSAPEAAIEVPLIYMSCNDEACVRLQEFFEFTLKATPVAAPKPAVTPPSGQQAKPAGEEKKSEKKNVDGSKSVEKTGPTNRTEPKTVAQDEKKETAPVEKANAGADKAIDLAAQTAPKADKSEETATTEEAPKKKKKKKKKVKRTSSSEDKGAKNAATRQILEPVKWSFDQKDLGNNTAELLLTAKIEPGWYVYSQNIEDGGPIPTNISFKSNPNVVLLDKKPREISRYKKEGFDKMFDMNIVKYAKEVTFAQKVKLKKPDAKIEGSFLFQTCDDSKCLPPNKQNFAFNDNGKHGIVAVKGKVDDSKGKKWKEVIAHCGITSSETAAATAWWRIFILGFLGGFAALLTPCVFPMIPLTVSFFTKRSKNQTEGIRNALIYAVSIVVIYVGLGFFVTVAFGPSVLNALSTDPWFNLFFFIIFVVFAISFFGYFEITLPSSLVNKVSAAEEKGGLIGIFFMAFTLALVSFSCTGPIIGTLLVEAAVNGEQAGPILGMTGFAVALALPFALFAAFPGWLNSLPRSGGWLNTVKVVLGFIELIFALKFLSNADLTPQLGLLKREVFLGIWIILLLGLALYLIGKIRFPHDSPLQKITIPRMASSAFCVLFAGYLVQGIFCQPLPLVSGFPPPIFYSYSCGGDGANIAAEKHIEDLEKGIVEAQKEGKPLLVDFTGWACVNCRKMEENVWSKMPDLLHKYTVVSLYVDEKKMLPESEQFVYEVNGKKRRVRTVGDKWSYLQSTCLGTNTQPFYVLMNEKGEFLNQPVGYTPDLVAYSQFLEEGLKNYKSGKTIEDQLGMAGRN